MTFHGSPPRTRHSSPRQNGHFVLRGRRSRTALVGIAAVAWLLAASAVMAHDWYPPWCCSDGDCRALLEEKGETVLEVPEGWRLWDGRVIARRFSKPSPDPKFHLCEEPTTKAIICFFAPPGSS